jgi:hypothetical protein
MVKEPASQRWRLLEKLSGAYNGRAYRREAGGGQATGVDPKEAGIPAPCLPGSSQLAFKESFSDVNLTTA